jgi:hypothetical protein
MFTETQTSAYKAGLVRFHQGHKVIGAGLHFCRGYILTCAHIVTQSLNLGKTPQGIAVDSVAGKAIQIDFPFIAKKQFQNAEVVPELWQLNNEDLAILKIKAIPDGASPLSFPKSTYYRDDRYHVCGFPDGHPDGLWSQGTFLEEQAKGWVQIEDTKTQGVPIEPGFSGAPVWDEQLGGIAGIAVARDQDREEAKVGFMIPYQRLKPALEAIALFDLLLPEADMLAAHWQSAYRLLRPEISIEPYPETLQEAILQVQNMPERGSDYRAIEQFIGYLARQELGPLIQLKLLQWLQNQSVDVDALLEAIRQKAAKRQAEQPIDLSPHLLFWVQAELNSDRYSVQAYLVSDREKYDPLSARQLNAPAEFLEESGDGKVGQSEIEKILRACLYESSQTLGDIRKLRLEIFLPLDRLDWEVDRWAATDDPEPDRIGCRYQVVIRTVRWENNYSQYQGDWKDKWKTVAKFSHRPAHRGFICGDGQKFRKIRQHLRDAKAIGLVLTQCPTRQPEGSSNPFLALLHAGSPVAIWFRQNLDLTPQSFQQFLVGCPSRFEELIATTPDSLNPEEEETDGQALCNGLLGCALSQLPENVRALRNQAEECDDGETHVECHVGFIWEDPNLVPPNAAIAPRLRMSA